MPLFLGCQCWFSLDDKTPFPGTKAMLDMLYVHVLVCFVFFLKPWRNVSLTCLMVFVLTRYKTVLKTLLLGSSFSE